MPESEASPNAAFAPGPLRRDLEMLASANARTFLISLLPGSSASALRAQAAACSGSFPDSAACASREGPAGFEGSAFIKV